MISDLAGGAQPLDTRALLRVHRMICAAMGIGVLLVAAVALFITRMGRAPFSAPESAAGLGVLVYAWLGIGAVGLAVALKFRQSVVDLTSGPGAQERIRTGELTLTAVGQRLIVSWALLEGSALFGIVVFILTGRALLLAGSIAVIAVGLALCFPRAEWYLPFEEGVAPGPR